MLTTNSMLVGLIAVKFLLIKDFWCRVNESGSKLRPALNISTLSNEDDHKCVSEVSHTRWGRFAWYYFGNGVPYSVSADNICWNHTINDIVIRTCDLKSGKWFPEEVLCSPPKRKNSYCPEDLVEIAILESKEIICLRISGSPNQFNEEFCYGSNRLPYIGEDHLTNIEMQYLIQFLRSQNILKFWLPVKESTEAAFKIFSIQLPGRHWGKEFDKNLRVNISIPHNQCVFATVENSRFQLNYKATDCLNLLHSICVFKENFVTLSGCPQNFGAISYMPHECYGVDWEYGLFPKNLRPVNISEYIAKRNIFQLILKEMESKSKRFFVVEYFEDNNNLFAIEMNAKEKFRISTAEDKQPALSSELLNNRKKVELTLKLNADQGELTLNVYNRDYIWRITDEDDSGINCYTNAGYDLIEDVDMKLLWENELKTKSIFKLKLPCDTPGQYWCKAHTIFNFTQISTQKVVAVRQKKGHVFVMLFEDECKNDKYLCPEEELKSVSKRIKKLLNEQKNNYNRFYKNFNIYSIRIMDIEFIETNTTFVRYLCHASVSLELSSDKNWNRSSEEVNSEDNFVGVGHDDLVRMQEHLILKNLLSSIHPHLENSVKSSEYCFPESFRMSNDMKNQWNQASYSQRATSAILCIQKNGLPLSRMCMGNFLTGAAWEDLPNENIFCVTSTENNIITPDLYELYFSNTSSKKPQETFESLRHILKSNVNNLIAADLYYIAKTIYNAIESSFNEADSKNDTNVLLPAATVEYNHTANIVSNIFRIYNSLMTVDDNILKLSVILNSTNILLDAFECSLDKISLKLKIDGSDEFILNESTNDTSVDNLKFRTLHYGDIGVIVKTTANFMVLFINPNVANITGIALFDSEESSEENKSKLEGAFKTFSFRFILANQSAEELLYEENMELATFVPWSLWQRLDEISYCSNYSIESRPIPKILIKIFANDKFFQENGAQLKRPVGERIISVSIPGHDTELPEILPFIFKTPFERRENESENCSYWNYSNWANDGLLYLGRSKSGTNLILCGSTHLTPFAYLVGSGYANHYPLDSEEVLVINTHSETLDFITILGCSLSLFGIIGIFATATTFQSWRQKASSKIMLQLLAAIALQMILFCFVNIENYSQHLVEKEYIVSCICIGVSLHYFVLVQFFWMFIIAYLQFKRYVQIFGEARPKRFLLKASLFGWGVPVIPVLITVLLGKESYIPSQSLGPSSICYPSGKPLYLGVLFPIAIIICFNLIIFVAVSRSIIKGSAGALRHTEKTLALSQIRLSALLFFLLGFTWIFGLMAAMGISFIFSYLFCLTATLQGFVLFVYFVILDPVTRRMWLSCFQKASCLKNGSTLNNSTSLRTTT